MNENQISAGTKETSPNGVLHRSDILKTLKHEFPDLADRLNEWEGNFALEMGEFRRNVQAAIEEGNTELVRKCFEVAEQYARSGKAKIANSIGISYVKALNCDSSDVI